MSLNQRLYELIEHKKIDNIKESHHYDLTAVVIDNKFRPISKILNNCRNVPSHDHLKSSGHAEMNAIQSAIKDKTKCIL